MPPEFHTLKKKEVKAFISKLKELDLV